MPVYNVYIWAWSRLFGAGEFALRASNVPFVLMLSAALGWTSYRVFRRPLLWVVFCFSPFVVFYMNEARPYIAVMGCAAVSTGTLLAYFADRPRYATTAPWLCLASFVLGCGMHMLAAFLVPVLAIHATLAVQRDRLDWRAVWRDWKTPVMTSLPLLFALACYYAWTILNGIGGTRGSPGIGNIAFAVWEFAGMAGLGPPRNQLRAAPDLRTLMPYALWSSVGIVALGAALVALTARRRDAGARRPDWALVEALVAGGAALIVLAVAAHFEFWGRHLSVFFPGLVFATIQMVGDGPALGRRRGFDGAALTLLVVVWLLSNVRLIADPRYSKDDYRAAATAALDEAARTGGAIAWAADPVGARYYGVDLRSPRLDVDWPVKGRGVYASSWSAGQVSSYLAAHQSRGAILVLSKPDLYDRRGAWSAAVRGRHARRIASANSFNVYTFP